MRRNGFIECIAAIALCFSSITSGFIPRQGNSLGSSVIYDGGSATLLPTVATQTTTRTRASRSSRSFLHHFAVSDLASSDPSGEVSSDDSRPEKEPCNVVFTHTNADFDSLAGAVAVSLLWKHENPSIPTHVVLPRGAHPGVERFLAFHKHLLPVRGFKTIMPEDVIALGVVDTQSASRIGRGQSWLENAKSIHIFDHHPPDLEEVEDTAASKDPLVQLATEIVIEEVGSTTTLLVERLKEAGISPAPHEATLFCLGIRADTGGLVYEGTTIRDAAALLWCLEKGASQMAISEFGVEKVSESQRTVLNEALGKTETEIVNGLRVSSVLVSLEDQYVAGLAQVCMEVLELTDSDVFLLGATHRSGSGKNTKKKGSKKGDDQTPTQWISLIGRASPRAAGVDLNVVMRKFGGGGHPKAAAAALRCKSTETDNDTEVNLEEKMLEELVVLGNDGNLPAEKALSTLISIIKTQIPEQLIASSCMCPVPRVVTVHEDQTVAEARKIFDDNGLKSVPVVDSNYHFKSSLKYNDLVKASRAGRSNDKVKGMIRPSVETVHPDTDLAELEDLLINKGVGRIPVVDDDGVLVGIITRTDVLRQHNLYGETDLDKKEKK